jgi:hypothetical protein
MFFSIKRPLLMVLAGGVAFAGPILLSGAQQPAPPPGPPVNSARIQAVPTFVPGYGTNVYMPYGDPYGGYMQGAANVISSQGQFMIDRQQSNLMNQQVKRSKLDTRRAQLDEYMYERKTAPTPEDQAEKARIEQLRISRNDPPLTTIWSGEALNTLMTGIQRQIAQRIARPDVPLAPDVVNHINVTGGRSGNSLALLKNGGRLNWPYGLTDERYKADRQLLDKLALSAYSQANAGAVDGETIRQMANAVNDMQATMRRNVANMDANDYTQGLRFLRELNDTINVLKSPDVGNFVSGAWQARGNSVAQLVQNMTSQGVRFAPALPADEASYVALQRSMADYYAGPDAKRPWDPLAK